MSGVVVELRVHGVSGTPPEAMLGTTVDDLREVRGDEKAGFYRRSENGAAGPWRRVLEAYSWGGLTSGPASRALWLLFLPFIFINLAHWMLPPAAPRRRLAAALSVGALRVIALSFTLTLMLATAVVVIDVIVWQCVGLDYCGERFWPLGYLVSWPRGLQVAVGALPLMAVIGVLWRLGRENARLVGEPPDPAVTVGEVPLESATFWALDPSVSRLRACHVIAWTAGLAGLVLAVPVRYGTEGRAVSIGLLAINGLILGFAVVAAAWNPATARGGSGAERLTGPLQWLRWVSLAVLGASLTWTALARVAKVPVPSHYPDLHRAIYAMFIIQIVLLTGLFACTAWSMFGLRRPADDGFAPSLRGFASPFVALVGWLVACGFSVGVGLLAAQGFGRAVASTTDAAAVVDRDDDAPLIVPPQYFWTAVAIAVLIVVAALTVLWVWWWVMRSRRGELRAVLEEHPGATESDSRAKEVASSRAWAAVTDLGPPIVGWLAVVAVGEIAVLLVWQPEYSPAITNVSVFIAAALAAALVAVVVAAYRYRQLRRVVAVLWDVITFWPRANHPLTPPCYGERTVPDLVGRTEELVDERDTRVVLAAHSQGSIIAAASVLQMRRDRRVALLTFGSPLRRLYTRNFPAYFGIRVLAEIRSRQRPRWINLWAHSDPIGSWVTNDLDRGMHAALRGVDFRLLDVESLARGPDGSYPPICGHSGFWERPEYRDAMREFDTQLLPEGSATDTGATAAPTVERL
ncbi:hypothetical protein [Mycobacterium hubeiense]|uniref:hypothetical protein n=1 Tax=Mycobacterium hubeiense TaxID=1867256 RepID=UPI001E299F83|nr:hypothetical protein [Mycobacterium sp. QGD 101]